jgi:hypothetical protein
MPNPSSIHRRLPLGVILLASVSFAQGSHDVGPALDAWRARYGASWRIAIDEDTGRAEMLYGGGVKAAATPVEDGEFEALARARIAEAFPMFGIDAEKLALVNVQFLPLGQIGSSDKTTVRFQQKLGDIPVEGGYVNALFDMRGRLLSIQSRGVPMLAAIDPIPVVDAARAAQIAATAFAREAHLAPTQLGTPSLVVVRVPNDPANPGRLAWRVESLWSAPDAMPIGFAWKIDARDGSVLDREKTVLDFDVRGTVKSMITPGFAPDTASNPEVATPMRYITVTSSAGTTTTDANGAFVFPGVNSSLAVTVNFTGTFNDVLNDAGAEYSLTQTVPANTNNVVLTMNPLGAADVTAQANVFHHVNVLRDWVRSVNPTDAHADHVALANANLAQTCNAYFNGGSTNYFQAGGSCANTAYSTVIGHENGHWLNQIYGTGNGSDGMGEGNADMWAMYCYDVPQVGLDFCGSGCNVRTGLNTRPFCGDSHPACYGEVHADGEPWMGAGWKVRARLAATLGSVPGKLAANNLFLGWMNAYNQQQIKSVIEIQWLTLDDDDADIDSGTPHLASIDGGFRDQQFPGFSPRYVTITAPTLVADTDMALGPYGVDAIVETHGATVALSSVTLQWRVNGGALNSVPMVLQGPDAFSAAIPVVPAASRVDYEIVAVDNSNRTYVWPETAPSLLQSFRVGVETPLFFDDFEAGAAGWTHGTYGDTANATDEWQLGTPAGKSGTTSDHGITFYNWRDAAGAFSGTQAFGTDLGLGTSDGLYTSNEHCWLRSPVWNASGMWGMKLRYRRWMSCDSGASDQLRIRVNGNVVWTNDSEAPTLETAWSLQELDISHTADDQASLQIEFELRTNPNLQFGGWNIDDVQIVHAGPSTTGCTIPSGFGPGKVNSTGFAATLASLGTPSPSGGFQLTLYNAPAQAYGVVYSSAQTSSIPYLGGTLLLGSPLTRDIAWHTSVFGDVTAPLPVLPAMIGTTRYYQALFLDPASNDGFRLGMSRALRVDFCP